MTTQTLNFVRYHEIHMSNCSQFFTGLVNCIYLNNKKLSGHSCSKLFASFVALFLKKCNVVASTDVKFLFFISSVRRNWFSCNIN